MISTTNRKARPRGAQKVAQGARASGREGLHCRVRVLRD
jgi:hypothetical protein